MTIATIKVEIANPKIPFKWQPIKLPLRRLGIRPYVQEKFLMPDGGRVMRWKGVAKFRYKKKIGGGDVLFGVPGDPTVLGELILGSIGLQLDRRTGELKPLPLILGNSQSDTFPPRPVR